MIQQNSMPNFTPEQSQQAQAKVREILQKANMPAEKLAEIGQWAERVIHHPQEFKQFQAWLRDQKLPAEDIPDKPDFQELMAMVVVGKIAGEMAGQEPAVPEQPAAGPVSPEQLQGMAAQGRNGDTMLAHINPQEAAALRDMGGMGTVNPATGLQEFNFFSDLWKGVKSIVKQVAPFVLPIAAIAFPALIPAVGTALGASGAMAGVVGAAAISGGVTALSGGSLKQVLTSAAITGLGSYLSPIVGKYVGEAAGITSTSLQSAIGSAALAGGFSALRGGTVSQVLTAAATGAAANYLGQVASSAIGSGGITNTKITQSTFDDAVFAASDAEQLAKQGLGKNAITQVLQSSGLTPQVAQDAATLASDGKTAVDIATSLSNKYAGMTVGGKQSLYTNGQTGVQNSILGGANVKALETLQKSEDAYLIANDAAQLKAQGLNEAAIKQNLIAAGVDSQVADFAASNAVQGKTVDAITSGINQYYPGVKAFTDSATSGTTSRELGGDTITNAKPGQETAVAPIRPDGSTGEFVTQPPSDVAQVDVTGQPVSGGGTTTGAPAPSNTTGDKWADAEFAAADARQLAKQGLSQAQIESTLLYSGVTPMVAADAAQLAYMGMDIGTIKAGIVQSSGNESIYGKGSNIYAPLPGYTGAPGTAPGTSPGTALTGGTEGTQVPQKPVDTNPLSPEQVGAITGTVPTANNPQTPPKAPDMGTFTPQAPGERWKQPLVDPGLNPGWMGLGVTPAYQTTSPVQSQYYWGHSPYMKDFADLAQINQNAPAQPWGIQQGYFEQPMINPLPIYGENMFPIPQDPRFSNPIQNPYAPQYHQTQQPPVTYPQPIISPGDLAVSPINPLDFNMPQPDYFQAVPLAQVTRTYTG